MSGSYRCMRVGSKVSGAASAAERTNRAVKSTAVVAISSLSPSIYSCRSRRKFDATWYCARMYCGCRPFDTGELLIRRSTLSPVQWTSANRVDNRQTSRSAEPRASGSLEVIHHKEFGERITNVVGGRNDKAPRNCMALCTVTCVQECALKRAGTGTSTREAAHSDASRSATRSNRHPRHIR
jgi:hypothetical protein